VCGFCFVLFFGCLLSCCCCSCCFGLRWNGFLFSFFFFLGSLLLLLLLAKLSLLLLLMGLFFALFDFSCVLFFVVSWVAVVAVGFGFFISSGNNNMNNNACTLFQCSFACHTLHTHTHT